jgi:hypothetical protein
MRYDRFGGFRSVALHAYRVTVASHHGAPRFADFPVGAAVSAELHLMHVSGVWDLLAWVLLPCRLEALFIVRCCGICDTTAIFLSGASRRAARAAHAERMLWAERFEYRAMRNEDEIAAAARDFLDMPVRAHLVERRADYPFWDNAWLAPAPAGRLDGTPIGPFALSRVSRSRLAFPERAGT